MARKAAKGVTSGGSRFSPGAMCRTAGELVKLNLSGMSHTQARRHQVKSIEHRMVAIDRHFVPVCEIVL